MKHSIDTRTLLYDAPPPWGALTVRLTPPPSVLLGRHCPPVPPRCAPLHAIAIVSVTKHCLPLAQLPPVSISRFYIHDSELHLTVAPARGCSPSSRTRSGGTAGTAATGSSHGTSESISTSGPSPPPPAASLCCFSLHLICCVLCLLCSPARSSASGGLWVCGLSWAHNTCVAQARRPVPPRRWTPGA